MNVWNGVARLASDPVMKASKDGAEVCTFRVACDSGWGDKKSTAWLHIVTFGKTAINCDRFLKKGRQVAIEGRISTGSYTKQDGTKVYTTDIIANNVEFLSGGSAPKQTTEEVVQQEFNALPEDLDDSLPF